MTYRPPLAWEGNVLEQKKTVLKPVKQWEQLGNTPNWKLQTFLNKNHPNGVS